MKAPTTKQIFAFSTLRFYATPSAATCPKTQHTASIAGEKGKQD